METSRKVFDKFDVALDNSSYHAIELNGKAEDGLVEPGFDIVKFSFVNPSVHLKQVNLVIGGMQCASFAPEDFANPQTILPEGLPLSKLIYHRVYLQFVYDEKYIEEHEESMMVDEYEEKPCLSYSEEEFYNGSEYHRGHRVEGYELVPTGRKIKRIIEAAVVEVPEIHIDITPASSPFDISVNVPVWQTLVINKKDFDESYFKRLIERHTIHVSTGEDVNELYNKDVEFDVKIKNFIRVQSGMGGLYYSF
jgi:hypothetical protein